MSSIQMLEFRPWDEDDSWFDVRLELSGENLTIKYEGSPDEDEVFNATAYGTPEKLHQLEKRFRPRSQQMQDRDCSKLIRGITVCASHQLTKGAFHFYDAVVQEVCRSEHSLANGEEDCLCTFILAWKHGPSAGNLTGAKVANICLIQPSALKHPILTSFLKMARKKFAIVSYSIPNLKIIHVLLVLAVEKYKSSVAQHAISELKCEINPIASEGVVVNLCERMESGANIVGESSHHFVLVDNLEKGLDASTINDFIHEQTSIAPQAYVFPSLEPYTRGIIALDCKKKFEKICCFMDSPNHVITSSKGRPWVTTKKVSITDPTVTLLLKSQNQLRCGSVGSQLKLVYSGMGEYDMSVQRRDLYIEFFSHMQRLQKSLVLEENRILKQSSVAVV